MPPIILTLLRLPVSRCSSRGTRISANSFPGAGLRAAFTANLSTDYPGSGRCKCLLPAAREPGDRRCAWAPIPKSSCSNLSETSAKLPQDCSCSSTWTLSCGDQLRYACKALEFFLCQPHGRCRHVLVQMLDRAGSRNGKYDSGASQKPRQRYLHRCCLMLLSDFAQRIAGDFARA